MTRYCPEAHAACQAQRLASCRAARHAIDRQIEKIRRFRKPSAAQLEDLAGLEAALVDQTRLADIAEVASDQLIRSCMARFSSQARSAGRAPVEMAEAAE